ncbi:MAG: glutamate--tRNA ligase [Candidatus Lightella neohaematopini]|nr:glutamate--tRNA ligase [Candidatus Lightella neohaematopini]MCV2528656.1 glutamate--tRNA ligase [Candidatus Lightella neohaematopini]
MSIITRFSPSPTGYLHIGSIRTALYSWLFARHKNGKFILRIEDTDLVRSNKEHYKQHIMDSMTWLGINWDNIPYCQTSRLNRYYSVIDYMLKNNIAYKCFCSSNRLNKLRELQVVNKIKPKYDGHCRNIKHTNNSSNNYVVRFRNPDSGYVIFKDLVRGKILFNNNEIDDLIILRANNIPTYNFCSVIDDYDMGITHIIRGEEHISNTPRQINILKSLGMNLPNYAHLSILLDSNGKKLSKRNKSTNIMYYYNIGILKEALINYIIRLGWSYGNKEIFNLEEVVNLFSLNKINKSPSKFDINKLLWYNGYYMKNLPINYITNNFINYVKFLNLNFSEHVKIKDLLKLTVSRCNTMKEIIDKYQYLYNNNIDLSLRCLDNFNISNKMVFINVFKNFILSLKKISNWSICKIQEILNQIPLDKENKKTFYQLLRFLITNSISSPPLSQVIYIIGKFNVINRIRNFFIVMKR